MYRQKKLGVLVGGIIIIAFLAAAIKANAQVIPAQNQVTATPYGGILYATSTSPTAKIYQLKGSSFGQYPIWNGSIWVTSTTTSGGSGTVTQVNTSYPVLGGPITTTGTISLDFGTTTANTWALLQTFTSGLISNASSTFTALLNMRNASSTLFTVSTNTWFPYLGTAAGTLLAVDPNGKLIATSTPASSGGTVTSVTAATPNSTLTLGGTNPITTSGTINFDLNLAHSNFWTALQNFTNASTSMFTATSSVWFTGLATPAGTVLAVDPNGKLIATTTPQGTLTAVTGTYPVISSGGTTPAISLAFGTTTANSWSALQSFSNASTSLLTVSGNTWLTNLATAAGAVLAVDPNGKIISTTTSQGTVTSITAGTGLNGGTITNTGTISLKSYLATSSSESNGGLAYWTSTAATPALLGTAATGTVAAGTGISVTAGQSIIGSGLTITNTGVTSLTATSPLSRDTATGAVTISCATCTTGGITALGNYSTTTGTAISFSTTTKVFNGLTFGQTIGVSASALLFTPTVTGTLDNTGLTNSSVTINTTAPLGGGGALSLGGTLTLTCTTCDKFGWPWTPTSNFGTTTNATGTPPWFRGNPYSLFASSTSEFDNSSTTFATIGTEWLPSLATAAGSFLAVDNNGKIIATTTPASSGSVTGTTGQVVYMTGTNVAAGTSTLFLTPAGVLGLGTTNPVGVNANSKFTIAGPGSQDGIASTTDNTASSDAIWQTYSDSARSFIGSHGSNQTTVRYGITLGGWSEIGFFNSSASTTNGAIIGINTAKPIVFGTNNLDRGRIDGSGNWGIGTTSPGTLLSVGNTTGINFSTATSTWSTTGGINITAGCYGKNGNCIGQLSSVKKQVFTGSGTYNASTGMIMAQVECVGGGGGAGGVDGNASFLLAGSGGGSGGYSRAMVTPAQVAGGVIVGIGSGGTGGADGSSIATDGGQTTFGSLCVANGGIHGIAANVALAGAGGAGGAAGTGDIAAAGYPGGTGVYSTGAGITVAIGSGIGGSSFFGGGGAGVAANGAGIAGRAYGSGGSGGYENGNGASVAGGNGSAGVIYVTEYTSQ